jgi:hypothetical protein
MSVAVDLQGLDERIAEFGAAAFLVTVGDDGRPHVTSVSVSRDGDRLTTRAGRRTRANLAARPTLTLLWPPGPGGVYSLLVDGETDGAGAGDDDPTIAVTPTHAVLHRVADAAGEGPTCLPVGDPAPAP